MDVNVEDVAERADQKEQAQQDGGKYAVDLEIKQNFAEIDLLLRHRSSEKSSTFLASSFKVSLSSLELIYV